MQLEDGGIDPGGQAEVVRVDDQASHNPKCTNPVTQVGLQLTPRSYGARHVDFVLSISKFRRGPDTGASMFWLPLQIVFGFYLFGSLAVIAWYGYRTVCFLLVAFKSGRQQLRSKLLQPDTAGGSVVSIDSHWRFAANLSLRSKELLESQEQTRKAW